MAKSNIEWTQETWNPLTGCSRKSEGCKNCYSEKMTKRLEAIGIEKYQGLLNDHGRFNGNVRFDRDALMIPLKRKKPTTYFVNSMSDWCHENVPDDWRDQILAVMALTPQHTYQVLTKRAIQMQEYLSDPETPMNVIRRSVELQTPETRFQNQAGVKDWWPLKNVWFGVSVEDQKAGDERIPLLLDTPSAVRFLSVEPLLEYVRIKNEWLEKLDLVIVGGESGANARPMQPDWVRSLRDQCQAAGVPFFFKQWGKWVVPSQMPDRTYQEIADFGQGIGHSDIPIGVGKHRAGRLLDGREWNEMPSDKKRAI